MKYLFCMLSLLLLMVAHVTAKPLQNESELLGTWMYMDTEGEVPDVILFNVNGRYIVFNDMDGDAMTLPIIEKGNWHLDQEDASLKLEDREVVQPHSGFVECHSIDHPVIIYIDNLSKQEIKISYTIGDERITESYKKIVRDPRIKCSYTGVGACTNQLDLFRPKTLLKIRCDFSEVPVQLVVEDADENELFRTERTVTEGMQHYEILLADLPNAIKITELIFKTITSHPKSKWKFDVEVY